MSPASFRHGLLLGRAFTAQVCAFLLQYFLHSASHDCHFCLAASLAHRVTCTLRYLHIIEVIQPQLNISTHFCQTTPRNMMPAYAHLPPRRCRSLPLPTRPTRTPSPPPFRPFCKLPVQLALMIIEFITCKRDLASLSRVCWDLWGLTFPALYEHFYITDKPWPMKDPVRKPLVLEKIRDVTIVRHRNPNGFFHDDHGARLFRSIPHDQLRRVHFFPSRNAECPASFVYYIFHYQRNVEILDIRWPLSYTYHISAVRWRTDLSRTLTTIAVMVQCVSPNGAAQVTAEILASCSNLKYLFASCCVHRRFPGMPDMFDVTARTLVSRGVKLRLKILDLRGCPNSLNPTRRLCSIFRDIVDFSDLNLLALQEAMGVPTNFLWMIAKLNQGLNIRDVIIQSRYPRDTPYTTIPFFPSLDLNRLVFTERYFYFFKAW